MLQCGRNSQTIASTEYRFTHCYKFCFLLPYHFRARKYFSAITLCKSISRLLEHCRYDTYRVRTMLVRRTSLVSKHIKIPRVESVDLAKISKYFLTCGEVAMGALFRLFVSQNRPSWFFSKLTSFPDFIHFCCFTTF